MTFENFTSKGPLKMTLAQARDIFEKRIIPAIGAKGQAPDHPTLVVVAGQPGSGKSTAIRQAELGLSGATQKIIGDDFDAWVPGYYELAKTNPSDAVNDARQAGSGYFIRETASRAERMRANIVLEVAVPTNSAQQAGWYRNSGYRTELHIVATPHHLSWTGVLDRAERALRNGHIGTNVLCPWNAYKEAYVGWPRAVFDAEQGKQYDRIHIKRRDGTIIYDNHLIRQPDGTKNWAQPAQGLEALLRERHRAVSDADASRVENAWDRIVKSEHMQSDGYLRSLPLRGYQKEIVNYAKSEGSRFDVTVREPGKFGPATLTQWHKTIVADLSSTRSSRRQFGHSEAFDNRTNAYGAALEAFASEYHKRSNPWPINAALQGQPVGGQSTVDPSTSVAKRKFEAATEVAGAAKKPKYGNLAHSEALRQSLASNPKTDLDTSSTASKSDGTYPDFSQSELREIDRIMQEMEARKDQAEENRSQPGADRNSAAFQPGTTAGSKSDDEFSDFSQSELREIDRILREAETRKDGAEASRSQGADRDPANVLPENPAGSQERLDTRTGDSESNDLTDSDDNIPFEPPRPMPQARQRYARDENIWPPKNDLGIYTHREIVTKEKYETYLRKVGLDYNLFYQNGHDRSNGDDSTGNWRGKFPYEKEYLEGNTFGRPRTRDFWPFLVLYDDKMFQSKDYKLLERSGLCVQSRFCTEDGRRVYLELSEHQASKMTVQARTALGFRFQDMSKSDFAAHKPADYLKKPQELNLALRALEVLRPPPDFLMEKITSAIANTSLGDQALKKVLRSVHHSRYCPAYVQTEVGALLEWPPNPPQGLRQAMARLVCGNAAPFWKFDETLPLLAKKGGRLFADGRHAVVPPDSELCLAVNYEEFGQPTYARLNARQAAQLSERETRFLGLRPRWTVGLRSLEQYKLGLLPPGSLALQDALQYDQEMREYFTANPLKKAHGNTHLPENVRVSGIGQTPPAMQTGTAEQSRRLDERRDPAGSYNAPSAKRARLDRPSDRDRASRGR
ncbi:zeta toxin family protein [Ensifer sp. YR511]|uniref:zeta toxin family protein n=1 Tax=Ensifer sp. YR511 TaxID=1855294 RepID=UPI000891D517|nr:zeta toxin family protein [Ensifer sp. YR511]SDO05811.1 Zeta toxin [Ensifer sp. YR511]